MLGYSPCSKGSSNPLSTASTPSDNLTERKFTFKKPMLLSEIHASPPCPVRSGLVDTQSFNLNFKSSYTSSSRHLHSDRRFRPGVGRLPETPKDFGNVDKEPTFLARKQKGTDGNFSQSKVFPKIPGECPCSNNDRQLNKCVLSKPYGREKISHSFKSGTRHLEIVPTKSYPHFSSICGRFSEHFRRSTLPLSTVEHRVDTMQENIPTDRGSLWISSDRSLHLIPKPPTKNILVLDSRPKSLKNRCIHFQLGLQPSLPVSSISSNSQMPFKDKERQIQGNTNSPSVEIKTLVSNYFRDANGSPSCPPNEKGSLATSPIKSNSSSPDRQKKELQTSHLACVRESLRLNNVPERVSKIIFASWRPGTEKHYQSAWRKFNSWCEERSSNSISCPITEILSFLSDLYYNGMQYRTINLYRSTIFMTHAPVDGCVIGSHPIVSRFMKGSPKYLVTWDVSVVLGYLKTLSPKNSLSLKQSTLKLAMLMALISFNRCDFLHKLDLRFHYFKCDGVNFIIPTHAKTSSLTKFKEIFFPAFPQDRRLCVVNYLKHYKEYTAEYRPKQSLSTPDPLLLSIVSPHKPISSTTFARWIKTVLKDSGIDTSMFGSHSTRSASTLAAQKLGVSVSDILKVADWSREAAFIKFYHKPIAPAHPGIQVLSSC